MSEIVHDTFVLQRTYPQSRHRVFQAFSVPEQKAGWYAQGASRELVRYTLDFRRGGREILVGRMSADTPMAGAILTWSQTFEDIVDDERIVFTQTLDVGDRRISCAVITVEFRAEGAGCTLRLTHQAAYLEGADGPKMREMGWRTLLDAVQGALGDA
jgi:uncharacterized protein YndB with AHSA1/START domain